jgi:ABC-type branched-subunit amino acid transport system substrate-binding protein
VIARVACAFAALLLTVAATASPLTPQQQRGKQLYLTGESATQRRVTALIGADEVEVAASVVPCGSCHARSGRGNPEGGITPSNLQWDVLSHPATTDDRTRAAYTPALLRRAITMGIDPSANHLQPTMPRYRMAIEEMNDLLAYIEKLGTDYDPGLTDDAIRIGAVLPSDEREQAAVRGTLTTWFDRLNRDGGVFGRRIEPRFTTTSGPADKRAAAFREFLEREQPFAVTAAWISGADDAMSAVAEEAHVPTIATFTAHLGAEDRRYVFQLLAGVREQSLALVAGAVGEHRATARVTILADEATDAFAAKLRDALTDAGCKHVSVASAASAASAASVLPADAQYLLYLGAPSRLDAVLAAAAALAAPPYVLIPVAHSSGDLTAAPAALDGRLLLALPSSPDDLTPEGEAELRALEVPPAAVTSARIALASAKLLVEALRVPGRDLDRDILLTTLETFYRTPTGLTPPITWTPSRHTGSHAVRIIGIDAKAKRWVDRGWWEGE